MRHKMAFEQRIEAAMAAAIARGQGSEAPSKLATALDYAVTPGGARIRPTLLLSVATACGDDRPALSDAAAVALELIHCASLVHDDLPASTMPRSGAASPRCIAPIPSRWRSSPATA